MRGYALRVRPKRLPPANRPAPPSIITHAEGSGTVVMVVDQLSMPIDVEYPEPPSGVLFAVMKPKLMLDPVAEKSGCTLVCAKAVSVTSRRSNEFCVIPKSVWSVQAAPDVTNGKLLPATNIKTCRFE